ncbi:MAG: DNA adenine methylase [Bacteroidia bacterium]|nr:DNA adenine methylase [Bacteroidia bacterium]
MSKNYNQSPLPFQGQKRRFNASFKEALNEFKTAPVFIDLFGGSGLLSHWVKEKCPDATVVYNDYDNYSARVANIERTNALLAEFRVILKDAPVDKVISKEAKAAILKAVRREEKRSGYVDYITISSSLLFSMNYATNYDDLAKQTMYNVVRLNDYQPAPDYLEGVEVVRMDYRQLFDRWKHVSGAVFLIDPPYLSTDCGTYGNYWKLANYLDVLQCLKGTSYFYFTSNKSSILELTEWISKNLGGENPFSVAKRVDMNARMNHNAGYVDIMLYKKSPQ